VNRYLILGIANQQMNRCWCWNRGY